MSAKEEEGGEAEGGKLEPQTAQRAVGSSVSEYGPGEVSRIRVQVARPLCPPCSVTDTGCSWKGATLDKVAFPGLLVVAGWKLYAICAP